MNRLLVLTFLALASPAVAQQTYSLRGNDSQQEPLEGWLRIESDGRLEYYARGRSRSCRCTIQASFRDGVYRGSVAETVGLTGALSAKPRAETQESLTVRPVGEEVEVTFVRGDYRAETRGTLDTIRYDLKLLRDEVPHSRVHRTSLTRSPQSSSREVMSYESRVTERGEERVYSELSKDGDALLRPGTRHVMRLTSSGWKPETKLSKRLQGHGLLTSSLRSVGVTELVPVEPVAVGEEWTLSPAAGARLLGVSGDDAEGSVRGRLLAVERVEGGLTYRIAFAFDLRLPLPGVDGLATIRVQQKVTQSPSLHSAQVRSHVRAKLAFDGSEHDQRNEQTLLRESLP